MAVSHDVSYRDGGVGNGDGLMAAAAAPAHFMDFNCFIDTIAITDDTAVTDAMANMWGDASNTLSHTPKSIVLAPPVPATLCVDDGVANATADIPPCVPAFSRKRRRAWTSAEHSRFLQAPH